MWYIFERFIDKLLNIEYSFHNFLTACLQSAGKDRKAYSPLDQAEALTLEESEPRSDNNNRSSTQNKNNNR